MFQCAPLRPRSVLAQVVVALFSLQASAIVTQIIDFQADPGPAQLDNPTAIAVDGNRTVYVAGAFTDNVFSITRAGVITEIIDSDGAGVGNPLDLPISLATDSASNVYVGSQGSGRVFKVAPGGAIGVVMNGAVPLDATTALAVDAGDNLFAAQGSDVHRVTPGGVATLVIDAAGGGFGFAGAVDLAVGPAGDVYAVGESSDNVLKLDTGFGISEVIGSAGDGMGNGLNSPDAVAVAPDGTVYVAGSDPSTSDLVIFAIYPDSSIELFHSAPSGAIRDLAVSSGGLLLAALDSEVALFEPDGTPGLPLVTAAGDGTHPLATAAKIAVDPVDDVYVAGVFSDNALRARLAALAAPALPVWGAPALVAGVLLGSGAVRRLRSRAS